MVVSPVELGTKNHCAGDGQEDFSDVSELENSCGFSPCQLLAEARGQFRVF
jgi:hypothetical protein